MASCGDWEAHSSSLAGAQEPCFQEGADDEQRVLANAHGTSLMDSEARSSSLPGTQSGSVQEGADGDRFMGANVRWMPSRSSSRVGGERAGFEEDGEEWVHLVWADADFRNGAALEAFEAGSAVESEVLKRELSTLEGQARPSPFSVSRCLLTSSPPAPGAMPPGGPPSSRGTARCTPPRIARDCGANNGEGEGQSQTSASRHSTQPLLLSLRRSCSCVRSPPSPSSRKADPCAWPAWCEYDVCLAEVGGGRRRTVAPTRRVSGMVVGRAVAAPAPFAVAGDDKLGVEEMR